MKTTLRIVLLLCVAAVAAHYGLGWNPLAQMEALRADSGIGGNVLDAAGADDGPAYRWRDAQGRLHYGNRPPAGVKAEPVSGGTVSIIEMPDVKAAQPAASDPLEGKTIRQLATERAIEQAAGDAR